MNIDQRVLPCFSGPPDLVAPLMLLHIWIRDRGLSRWLSVATMTIDHSMEIRIVDRPTYLLYYCSIDASRSSGCGQAASVDILRQALVCAIWLQCSSKPPPQVCSCSPGTGALKWKWVTFSECVLLLPLQRWYYHQLRKRITYYAPTRGGSIIAFILSLSSAQIILWRSIRYAFITLTPPMHITTQEGCSELVFSTSWWFLIKHNKNHPRCGKTNTCIWYECNTIHSLTASDCWRTQSGMFKLLCMGNNKIGTLHYSSLCCSHHPWAISFFRDIYLSFSRLFGDN